MRKDKNLEWVAVVGLGIYFLAAALVITMIFSCNGCKKQSNPAEPVVDTFKVAIDSMAVAQIIFGDSVEALNRRIKETEFKAKSSKEKVFITKEKKVKAEESGDTVAIILALKDEVSANNEYISNIEIVNADLYKKTALQDEQISNFKNQVSRYAGRVNELEAKVIRLEDLNKDLQKAIVKAGKKEKRAKAWLRVTGPLAGAGAVALIYPPVTLPAAAVAVVIYIISKPKNKKPR